MLQKLTVINEFKVIAKPIRYITDLHANVLESTDRNRIWPTIRNTLKYQMRIRYMMFEMVSKISEVLVKILGANRLDLANTSKDIEFPITPIKTRKLHTYRLMKSSIWSLIRGNSNGFDIFVIFLKGWSVTDIYFF